MNIIIKMKKNYRKTHLYKFLNNLSTIQNYKYYEDFPKYNKKTSNKLIKNELYQTKQNIKLYYGKLQEKKFQLLLIQHKKNLFDILESRIDIILHKISITNSIFQSRQLIKHGLINVNNKKINNYNIKIKVNDVITVNANIFEIVNNNITIKNKKISNDFIQIQEYDKNKMKIKSYHNFLFSSYFYQFDIQGLSIKIIKLPKLSFDNLKF